MTLLFLTCEAMPDLMPYDAQVRNRLRQYGVTTSVLVWEELVDQDTDWLKTFDVIVVRTIWDYYQKPEAFRKMLDFCDLHNINLHNDVDILRWNMDKRYLQELEQEGIEIIPTEFVMTHDAGSFERAQMRGWNQIVLKPMISGGSWHTYVLGSGEEQRFSSLIGEHFHHKPYMLQEFLPDIRNGEISTLRFKDGFTYSITKVPKAGDYRVQFNYGGSYHITPVHPDIKVLSNQIQHRMQDRLLYQRVDGVWHNGRFLLMEVELLEPDLYLGHHPEAMEEWIQQLLKLVRESSAR